MYKYLLPSETTLPSDIGTGNRILVTAELYGYLLANLPDDKWTYLEISARNGVEIIRVEGLISPNILVAKRGRDGTKPLAFSAGAVVRYTATSEAVQDRITPIFTVGATGVVSYYEGVFNVPPVSIVGLGGAISGGIFTAHGQGCGVCGDAPVVPDDLKPYRIVADGNFRITDDGSYRAYA